MRVFLVWLAVAICCAAAPAMSAFASPRWRWPVEGSVLRLFAVGPDRFAAGQHRGVDLAAPPGARVGAACGGRVSFAGRVPRGGRTVSVRCGSLVATYQHLGVVAVSRGQMLMAGARIGTVGRASPRPHVHLGARDRATDAYVDPLTLFAAGPRALPPPLPAARRPPPLGPSPVARRPVVAPRPAPVRVAPSPLAVPRALAARPALPWSVWLGLALFGFGLPLGGLVRVRRRRRRLRRAPVPVPRTAA